MTCDDNRLFGFVPVGHQVGRWIVHLRTEVPSLGAQHITMYFFVFDPELRSAQPYSGQGATWGIGALAHTAKLGWSASSIPLRVTTSLSAIGTQAFQKARWQWCEAPHQG